MFRIDTIGYGVICVAPFNELLVTVYKGDY